MKDLLTVTPARKSTHLDQYNNSWYQPGPGWKILLWIVTNAVFFNNSLAVFNSLKCWLLQKFGAKIGKGVVIKTSVNIKYPWFLEIGDQVWIGENVWIDNLTYVIVRNHVCISQGALLLTGNHNYKKPTFDLIVKGILLEDGVWIGARATVCPGVRCNSHAVLTVGAVATSDLEAYGIYSGSPAKKIKERVID
ncbi:MAG: putative colanic acid biosynthesis acetyltransferase WcaF [Segetibacter sp.]|nr:putative colanic acid biosynthesis acetyltransferase WcaF [Segetibacter sp.]